MNVYHRTQPERSLAVQREGFCDGEGYYLTEILYRGVWLSDLPLDASEGACGDALLAIDIPEDVLTKYEWVEEGKPYREFSFPPRL